MYGGSTGGWEALAAQVFYPDEFNGAYAACPDPIDFRAYTVVNIYEDTNAYYVEGPWKRTPRPGTAQLSRPRQRSRSRQMNQRELVLGTKTPLGPAVGHLGGGLLAGRRRRLPEAHLGQAHRRDRPRGRGVLAEHYDLSHILQRDWEKGLGQKLAGKINLYVGDMDNYYLNNAVYLVEDFLKRTTNPSVRRRGRLRRSRRALLERRPDAAQRHSRLRYHQMFIPKIVERIQKTAPPGADIDELALLTRGTPAVRQRQGTTRKARPM